MTDRIAAFLTARYEEIEAAASAATHLPGKDWDSASQGAGRERDGMLWDRGHTNVIAWFDKHIDACAHAALHDRSNVSQAFVMTEKNGTWRKPKEIRALARLDRGVLCLLRSSSEPYEDCRPRL